MRTFGNFSHFFPGAGGGGGHQEEHHDLFADLRRGERPNEAEYGALSTMTSIFGRMASYSGEMIEWEDAINSDLELADFGSYHSMDDRPPVVPDENRTAM